MRNPSPSGGRCSGFCTAIALEPSLLPLVSGRALPGRQCARVKKTRMTHLSAYRAQACRQRHLGPLEATSKPEISPQYDRLTRVDCTNV